MSQSKRLKLSIQLRKKSSRGPKFDGDAKHLEIWVKRKVALKPKKRKKEKKFLLRPGIEPGTNWMYLSTAEKQVDKVKV